jgi:hypothetical protein
MKYDKFCAFEKRQGSCLTWCNSFARKTNQGETGTMSEIIIQLNEDVIKEKLQDFVYYYLCLK